MWRKLTNVWLLACAIPLSGQSWETLRGLKPGDRVVVLDSGRKEHKGAFTSVSDQALSFESGKSQVSIERANVRRVQVPSGSRRLRRALIGIGIGVAIGAVADQTLGAYVRNEYGEGSGARALTYIAPIALVGGIAAAVPAYKTVYRAR